ncbi:MAG: 2-hydroxyacyl-CoA dehydratase, partial [Clostridia bacterium]|nr:2-hydroxyacyl-CoA dehydratase [Clostridia bacterium]
GIDAGSTTVKLLLCDDQGHVFRPLYTPNSGNPIPIVRKYLENLYLEYPDIHIRASAVTGYGEEIVKSAFHLDHSLVETVAHFTAAKAFQPDVDFILDIGGQDIKCFQIRGGAIDSIFLNEACSSGCGSFLMTFAAALGYSIGDFSKLGLFAASPVDLGSRCTVFMNSSVKQAQKDGATLGDISAGLSISVIKNALYKVIRCADSEALGKNIVVQGVTFLNDAVLRAFETEIGREVIRPKHAAMMGALGAALYAKSLSAPGDQSSVLTYPQLRAFKHETRNTVCGGCGNRCHLTVNTFSDGRRYIAGNRCERPVTGNVKARMNLYAFKRELLSAYRQDNGGSGPVIGIPMGLNLYELLPFWHTFFTTLGCRVITSPPSSRKLYQMGQHTIPSDTVCYPAKLMHGHIEALLKEKPDAIFYPEMSYNVDEGLGTNHFNCPVVAYYPEVIRLNVNGIKDVPFINNFVSQADRKQFSKRMKEILSRFLPGHTLAEIRGASEKAFAEYDRYLNAVREKAQEYLDAARREGKPVVVLSGRPYHVDPEICHGIDDLICSLGAAVITEDSLSHLVKPFRVDVMNQWTYHARLYAAAKYIAEAPKEWNLQLVQLVSFGCGVDAITTDEVRAILERAGCLYTQIKIDEISNMGAVKIRLRSLFSASSERMKRLHASTAPTDKP